jgi:hypothetical protein
LAASVRPWGFTGFLKNGSGIWGPLLGESEGGTAALRAENLFNRRN